MMPHILHVKRESCQFPMVSPVYSVFLWLHTEDAPLKDYMVYIQIEI